MIQALYAVGYSGPGVDRAAIFESLARWASNPFSAVARGYGLVLILSVVVIAVGRLFRWRHADYVVLPILLWGLQANWLLFSELDRPPNHPVLIGEALGSSAMALAVVAGILAAALISERTDPGQRRLPASLSIGVLAVATVVLDWVLVLICTIPLPE